MWFFARKKSEFCDNTTWKSTEFCDFRRFYFAKILKSCNITTWKILKSCNIATWKILKSCNIATWKILKSWFGGVCATENYPSAAARNGVMANVHSFPDVKTPIHSLRFTRTKRILFYPAMLPVCNAPIFIDWWHLSPVHEKVILHQTVKKYWKKIDFVLEILSYLCYITVVYPRIYL